MPRQPVSQPKPRPNQPREREIQKWDMIYASAEALPEGPALKAFSAEFAAIVRDLLPDGGSVLEAGCGGGVESLAIARLGPDYRVHLMDFSEDALATARRRFEQAGVEAEFHLGDVCEPSSMDCDLVFNAGVLEHYALDEQIEFLKGMATRSRRYVLAMVPNRLCYWYWIWRIHKTSRGNWPYGKELPLADLRLAFERAGLHFIGQTFLAESWTEDFVGGLKGVADELREYILEVHRHGPIAPAHKAYLLAALGTVGERPRSVPDLWKRVTPSDEYKQAGAVAALADALALRVHAEYALEQSELRRRDLDQQLKRQQSMLEQQQSEVTLLQANVADFKAEVSALSTRLQEKVQEVARLEGHVSGRDEVIRQLTAQLDAHLQETLEFKRRCAEQEKAIALLGDQNAKAERGLAEARAREGKLQGETRSQQARLNRQAELLAYLRAELALKAEEVRYRLGDAFVRAATNPKDLVLLPFRAVGLLSAGLRRRRERKRRKDARVEGDQQRTAAGPEARQTAQGATQSPIQATTAPTQATTSTSTTAATANGATGVSADSAAAQTAPRFEFQPVQMPDRPPQLALRAAVIMDEFSSECFHPECHLIPITPENWSTVVERERPEVLLVESAWHGNQGAWQSHLIRAEHTPDSPLLGLVEWCRRQSVPTVFWNKEDPSNFEHFIFAAKQFDYVFTTDEDCVANYRDATGHDRVWALPFAVQPAIHNPIGSREPRIGNLCFSGSYYARRHPERRRDLEMLLDAAMARGLVIFDRMHDHTESDDYRFPQKYQSAIRGRLPYPEMVDAYRRFRVFLNVNTVKESATMFARRLLEIIACGTPVISTWALSIEQLLGADAVALVRTPQDCVGWMELLLGSADLGERMVLRGQRRIFGEHTYEERLRFVLECLGKAPTRKPEVVTVITSTNRPPQIATILENYARQAYSHKELVLVLNNDAFDLDEVSRQVAPIPNARVLQVPEERTLGECLNRAIDEAGGEFWTKFDDDNYYGEHFLTDLMAAFKYADADLVGKLSYYTHLEGTGCLALRVPGFEHRYVDFLAGSAMIVRSAVSEQIRFPETSLGEDSDFLKACNERGFRMYSTDRFNYVCCRRASSDEHTWKVSDADLLRSAQIVAYTNDYRSHATV